MSPFEESYIKAAYELKNHFEVFYSIGFVRQFILSQEVDKKLERLNAIIKNKIPYFHSIVIAAHIHRTVKLSDETIKNEKFYDEVNDLHELLAGRIEQPMPGHYPVKRIIIEFKDPKCDTLVLSDKLLLWNFINQAFPYFKQLVESSFFEYIRKQYRPRGKGKRPNIGREKACKNLAAKIIGYLDSQNFDFTTKQKGNLVLDIFDAFDYKLPYHSSERGKHAYDNLRAIQKKR